MREQNSTYLSRLLSAFSTKILCYLRTVFTVMQVRKFSVISKSCIGQENHALPHLMNLYLTVSRYVVFLTDPVEDTLLWRLMTSWFTNPFSIMILTVRRTKSAVSMCRLQSKARRVEDNITNAECVNPSICVNQKTPGLVCLTMASVRFHRVIPI